MSTPFFALVHLWDAHTPRSYPARFENRRHGRNAYERVDRRHGRVDRRRGRAAGPETVVVLTGDHGENVTFEPRNLRDQAAWRRINRRLPIARWAQATVDHGVRSHSKRALRWAPRYFWNHGQTLLEELVRVPLVVAGPGIVARRAANAGEPRRPRADPGRPGRRAAPRRGLAGAEPRRVAARRGRAAGASRGDGDRGRAVDPAIRQQAIRDGRHKLITSFDDERVTDALYDLEADPGERRNLILAGPAVADRLRETLRALAPSAPRRSRWPPTRTRRSPSGCASWAICNRE